MEIRIKDSNTILELKIAKIEEECSDIIINWTNPDMRSGPSSFYAIHNKAGQQMFNSVLVYELGITNMKSCDSFLTIPGQLDCKSIMHVIMPTVDTMYVKAIMNIVDTVKSYKKDNVCRTISIPSPHEFNYFLSGVNEFLFNCGLEKIIIVAESKNELDTMYDFFKNYEYKLNKNDKINKFIDKTLETIGKTKLPKFIEWLLWGRKLKAYDSNRKEEENNSRIGT